MQKIDSSPSVASILCDFAPHHQTPVCGACCTRIEKLGVRYGSHDILRNINLHFHCGQLTAIIGPNGAGKTTLLRTILGQIPYTGELHFVDGERLRPDRPRIGYVPQKIDFDPSMPMSVLDLFSSAISSRPLFCGYSAGIKQKAREALMAVEAQHLLYRRLGELSGGEQQRVLLALSLVPQPDILLLDEPVASVDYAGSELFYRTVSSLRCRFDLAIILVSHDLAAAARVADRMVFLNKTIESIGTPAQVLENPLVQRTFGLDFSLPTSSKERK